MSDIELVIKIPEESYNYWKKHKYEYVLSEAIADGVVLPKGHGVLIDKNEYFNGNFNDAREFLDKATTIIEADKESKP